MKVHPTAKILRMIALLLACLLLLPAVAGCSKSSPTVLTVGEEKVSFDLLRYFVMNYRGESGHTAQDYASNEALQQELTEFVHATLREVMTYKALAEEYDIELTKEEEEAIDRSWDELCAEYSSEEALEKALSEAYLTKDVYMEIQRLQTLAGDLYEYLTNEHVDIIATDEATVRADVAAGNFFSAEYLYIYYVESDKAEKVAFAEDLHKRLLAGEKMKDLDDEFSATYGLAMEYIHLPAFTRTQQFKDFEDAVLALEIGGYTTPILRGDGILIARRLAVSDDYVENNIKEIIQSYKEREFALFVEKESEKMDIVLKKDYETLKYWEME